MDTLHVYQFLHILGAFMIVAGSGAGEIVLVGTKRARSSAAILALLSAGARIPLLTIPGALIALIFGSLLINEVGAEFSEAWISASYLSWVLAMGLSGAVLGPRHRKMHALAEAEVTAGREDSPALQAAANDPALSIVTHVLSALVLVFLYLMVFKPGN